MIYIILLLLFTACKRDVDLPKDIVAAVGPYQITSQDFRISYELTPQHIGKDDFSRKKAHLQSMIENKLLLIAGYKHQIHKRKKIIKLLKWYEEQAVRQELYRVIAKDKVTVDENELRSAFKLLNERIYIRHLIFSEEKNAWEVYHQIQNGISFENIVNEKFESEKFKQYVLTPQEFKWGDIDERLELAAFGLNLHEVSTPINSENGYHLLQLVDRKENIILTESKYQERKDYIEKIIRKRKEAIFAKEYAQKVLLDKYVKINAPILLELTKRVISGTVKNKPEFSKSSIPSRINIKALVEDLLDKELVVFKNGSWTIREFLIRLENVPVKSRPDFTDPERLMVKIALLVRDDYITKEGYLLGLDISQNVIHEVNRVKDELVPQLMWHSLLDTVTIPEKDFSQNVSSNQGLNTTDEILEQKKDRVFQDFLKPLKDRYPVVVFEHILDQLITTHVNAKGKPMDFFTVGRY